MINALLYVNYVRHVSIFLKSSPSVGEHISIEDKAYKIEKIVHHELDASKFDLELYVVSEDY